MRAPPEAGTTISAASRSTARRAAATSASPTATPIDPPMKREIERGDDRRDAADPALRERHRVAAGAERRLRLAQPLGVALAVAEPQRIDRDPRQLDLLEHAAVEQQLEARLRCRCGNDGRNGGIPRDWPPARGGTASARSPGISATDCPARPSAPTARGSSAGRNWSASSSQRSQRGIAARRSVSDEVVALEQHRLVGELGKRIGEAVAKVQPAR